MKSCCGDVTLWVLLEVPPHGGGGPWPRMTVGVVEWAMGNADDGKRAFSRAGRRSAGLGSKGVTRTHTHAVGVRARGRHPRATRIRPKDVPCGNHRR